VFIAEADNDIVQQANSTAKLNCTLPQNDTITWLHNAEKIDVELEQPNSLKVTVGEFLYAVIMCGQATTFLCSFSVARLLEY